MVILEMFMENCGVAETNSLTAGDETVDQVARLIDQIKKHRIHVASF